MVHHSLNVLLWILLANISGVCWLTWGLMLQATSAAWCQEPLAERHINKQEKVVTEPHARGVQRPRVS